MQTYVLCGWWVTKHHLFRVTQTFTYDCMYSIPACCVWILAMYEQRLARTCKWTLTWTLYTWLDLTGTATLQPQTQPGPTSTALTLYHVVWVIFMKAIMAIKIWNTSSLDQCCSPWQCVSVDWWARASDGALTSKRKELTYMSIWLITAEQSKMDPRICVQYRGSAGQSI